MEFIMHCNKKGISKYKYKINSSLKYKNIENKIVFIRIKDKTLILKIHKKGKYPFQRILFKKLDNKWFGNYPNSNDLILIEKNNSILFKIQIFKNQWQYRFNLLESIL